VQIHEANKSSLYTLLRKLVLVLQLVTIYLPNTLNISKQNLNKNFSSRKFNQNLSIIIKVLGINISINSRSIRSISICIRSISINSSAGRFVRLVFCLINLLFIILTKNNNIVYLIIVSSLDSPFEFITRWFQSQ
jgi:hypothetical protein